MYRLLKFRFLGVVFFLGALLLAALIATALSWRNVNNQLRDAATRAVLNAERLTDRTVIDLERLDGLRGVACDEKTVKVLQDAIYGSLSQIREIGLIRGGRLYCTNFGPTIPEVPIDAAQTKRGVHLDFDVNAVKVNNKSLYIYVSREDGGAANAVINPAVLA